MSCTSVGESAREIGGLVAAIEIESEPPVEPAAAAFCCRFLAYKRLCVQYAMHECYLLRTNRAFARAAFAARSSSAMVFYIDRVKETRSGEQ